MAANSGRERQHAKLERLLTLLHDAPKGSPKALAIRNDLALAVRGIVVKAAQGVARRYPALDVADLVQEGMLGVLPYLARFKPGHAVGKCMLPGYVATVSKQRMTAYAQAATSPVRITSGVRRKARLAVKRATEEGRELPECLVEEGLSPAHFEAAKGLVLSMAAESEPEPETSLSDARSMYDAQRALAQMGHPERYVLRALYGFDGKAETPRAVASRLGVSLEQVEIIRGRALRMARGLIEGGSGTCPPSSPSVGALAGSARAASTKASTRTGAPRKGSSTLSASGSAVSGATSTRACAVAVRS